jgi:adenosylcobinamide kinase/adenosylcobinamide-phosphate guanylyltransferase
LVRTLVLGGIRSGKSAWAESEISEHPDVRYIATGSDEQSDPSWTKRIAAHRDRRPQGWLTVESTDLATELQSPCPTLVDDIGGWLTAALDRRKWEPGPLTTETADLISAVDQFPSTLVLVSPEVGLTVVPTTPVGRRFADELGTLNQRLAQCCDRVVLVVAGLPIWVKHAPSTPSEGS